MKASPGTSVREAIMKRSLLSNEYVQARVCGVHFSERVRYVSGTVGSQTHHHGPLSVAQRFEEEGSRTVRIREAAPELYLRLASNEFGRVLVKASADAVARFVSFDSLTHPFDLDYTEVEVNVNPDCVKIKGVGSFEKIDSERHIRSFSDRRPHQIGLHTYKQDCYDVGQKMIKDAWAKQNGLYTFTGVVKAVDSPDYSSYADIIVSVPSRDETIPFSISIEDWETNPSLRQLTSSEGDDIENLEGNTVKVSRSENKRAVISSDDWYLYQRTLVERARSLIQRH